MSARRLLPDQERPSEPGYGARGLVVALTLLSATWLMLIPPGCSGGTSPNSLSNDDDPGENPKPASAVLASTQDVYVSSLWPQKNYDRAQVDCPFCFQTLELRPPQSSGGESWVYLKYSFDSIPDGIRIVSATLHFVYLPGSKKSSDDSLVFSVYRVTSGWNEGAVTWNTKPTHNSSAVASGELTGERFDAQVPLNASVVEMWLSSPAMNQGLVVIPSSGDIDESLKLTYSHEGDGLGITLELNYAMD